jgi:uncharacterized membrane protein YoaK (UPF0700 family)
MLPVLISLLIAVLFATFCARKAAEKNRSIAVWAILGFLFGIFALIAAFAVPSRSAY